MRSAILRATAVGLLLAAVPLPALAYENFDQGKSPPQLFMSDCSSCHRTPAGLGAELDPRALASFLAEHYTVSQQSADELANYLLSVRNGPGGSRPARQAAPHEKSHRGSKSVKRRHTKPHREARPVAKPRPGQQQGETVGGALSPG